MLKNDLDGQGRIKVDEKLRVKGKDNIFAIGDITDVQVSVINQNQVIMAFSRMFITPFPLPLDIST